MKVREEDIEVQEETVIKQTYSTSILKYKVKNNLLKFLYL